VHDAAVLELIADHLLEHLVLEHVVGGDLSPGRFDNSADSAHGLHGTEQRRLAAGRNRTQHRRAEENRFWLPRQHDATTGRIGVLTQEKGFLASPPVATRVRTR